MKTAFKESLKNFIFWISDKIVSGFVAAIKFLPVMDRFLTHWAKKLLEVMFRYKLASLVILVLLPVFSFLVLEQDGFFEPVFDALDLLFDLLFDLVPLDIVLPVLALALMIIISTIKVRRKISLAEAAKEVFFAFAARLLYLVIIIFTLITIVQFTPLKPDRRAGMTRPVPLAAIALKQADAQNDLGSRINVNFSGVQ